MSATRRDLVRDGLRLKLSLAGIDHQRCAGIRQRQCGRAPNPARTAGYDGDTPVQGFLSSEAFVFLHIRHRDDESSIRLRVAVMMRLSTTSTTTAAKTPAELKRPADDSMR